MIARDIPRSVVVPGDPAWPRPLDRLREPPDRLHVAGELPDLERAVAVVGTRVPDAEAYDFTYDLAGDLARAGWVVVSGGARGIDAAAHAGALAAGGRTVAVLATGLRHPYPKEHRSLFDRIARSGALVSEHDGVVAPHAGRFLERNRIVAALSCAVVVTQAPSRSGALNTASWARQLEIPVFAVPYPPWDPLGAGCVRLLASGATVCTRARDVLSVAAPEPGGQSAGEATRAENKCDYSDLDDDGRRVRQAMGTRARHVDEIARRAAIPVARVQRALLTLLLLGEIEERGAGRYGPCGRRQRDL